MAHKIEHDSAQDKVHGEVLNLKAEHVREHGSHDNHHKQGVEQAPDNAKHASTVLELEVFGYKGAKHEQVVPELIASLCRFYMAVSCVGIDELVSCCDHAFLLRLFYHDAHIIRVVDAARREPTKAPEAVLRARRRRPVSSPTRKLYYAHRLLVSGCYYFEIVGDAGMTLVSILVPIYNVDKYLRQCVSSILAQTYERIEVFLIDDGSTDESGRIADEFGALDERVHVLHKPNSGYGDSLNAGLAQSKGEWIAIVEPDDWVEATMVEVLLAAAEQHETVERRVDIVKGDYVRVVNELGRGSRELPSAHASIQRPESQPFSIDEWPLILCLHPSIWTALYRREFLDEFGILFRPIPGAGWADNPFFLETMIAARSIVYVDAPVYRYREFEDGTISHLRDWHTIIDRWYEMAEILTKYDMQIPAVLEAHACRGCAYLQMLRKDFEQTEELVGAAEGMAHTIDLDIVRSSSIIPKEYKLAYGSYLSIADRATLLFGWCAMQVNGRLGRLAKGA